MFPSAYTLESALPGRTMHGFQEWPRNGTQQLYINQYGFDQFRLIEATEFTELILFGIYRMRIWNEIRD